MAKIPGECLLCSLKYSNIESEIIALKNAQYPLAKNRFAFPFITISYTLVSKYAELKLSPIHSFNICIILSSKLVTTFFHNNFYFLYFYLFNLSFFKIFY